MEGLALSKFHLIWPCRSRLAKQGKLGRGATPDETKKIGTEGSNNNSEWRQARFNQGIPTVAMIHRESHALTGSQSHACGAGGSDQRMVPLSNYFTYRKTRCVQQRELCICRKPIHQRRREHAREGPATSRNPRRPEPLISPSSALKTRSGRRPRLGRRQAQAFYVTTLAVTGRIISSPCFLEIGAW